MAGVSGHAGRTERAPLKVFALGMAAGHLAQARGPIRNEVDAFGSKALRVPTRREWMLSHGLVACGWLRTAAEATGA